MKNFDFTEVVEEMKRHGMKTPSNKLQIQIPDAKLWLQKAMKYFIEREGKEMQWLPPYDEVAEWLSDNKGRGLLLYGNVGQGKTVLSRLAIPAIFLKSARKVVNVYNIDEMNAGIEEIKTKRIISLDDIGTETIVNDFGNKRNAFAEIMDNAEKTGQLVIISTNLGKDQLIEKYGDRVFDRILATTKRVVFRGESLRR